MAEGFLDCSQELWFLQGKPFRLRLAFGSLDPFWCWASVLVSNTPSKANMGRKRLIWLQFHITVHHRRDSHPQSGASEQRHSCLLSAHFLYSYTVLGPLAREWCRSQWGWARPHQLTFKTTTIVMPTGQSALDNPSVGFSLVSNCPWAGPWDSVLLTLFLWFPGVQSKD